MVRGEWQQECVNKDDVLEVVDQTLAIEKVIRAEQKVPITHKIPESEKLRSITMLLLQEIQLTMLFGKK